MGYLLLADRIWIFLIPFCMNSNREMILKKEQAAVSLRTAGSMRLPYGRERIFNLAPGFQALRVELDSDVKGMELLISVKEGGIE